MSNQSCQIKITTSFKAPLWEWCDMIAGASFIYVKTAVFVDLDEVAIDITADGFSMQVFDSAGILVDTLTLGTELVVSDTNKLNIHIGPPISDNAGTYTGTLIWTVASTGAVIPVIMFTFIFE